MAAWRKEEGTAFLPENSIENSIEGRERQKEKERLSAECTRRIDLIMSSSISFFFLPTSIFNSILVGQLDCRIVCSWRTIANAILVTHLTWSLSSSTEARVSFSFLLLHCTTTPLCPQYYVCMSVCLCVCAVRTRWSFRSSACECACRNERKR